MSQYSIYKTKSRVFLRKFLKFLLFLIPIAVNGQSLKSPGSGVLLKYNLTQNPPITFYESKSKEIIIGDGHLIYKFSSDGRLLLKFVIPNTNAKGKIFTGITGDYTNDNNCFIEQSTQLLVFDFITRKINSVVNTYGEHAQRDSAGNYYSLYQYFNEKENVVENKMKVISNNGKVFTYDTSIDLGADNFQIIKNDIVMYVPNSRSIFLLPIVGINYGKIKTIKANLPDDKTVRYLGEVNGKNIFQYFDYKKKTDIFCFFDDKMKLIKKQALSLPFEPISEIFKKQDDGDWLTEFPSGNIYSFNNKKIYMMRNTEKGTFIYDLGSLLNL